ncbi:MAG: helix-turn-helix domain-containing protein [Clostridiales bacterium]|nr:helix-turn-helix domain-containing protein [Clostridiales bacterium]
MYNKINSGRKLRGDEMDYSLSIWSIATFIESNIKEDIKYEELEQITGFSYRHLRSIIKSATGISLSNYILNRRIANAAFDLIHSVKPITDIAFEYSFNSYDAFARAFKRITGKSPKQFREGKYNVGHRRILMSFYAPEIYKDTDITYNHPTIREDLKMEKRIEKGIKSCILFGVPKVSYTYEECTPLAVSIKAALNYMGDQIDYTYLMAAMGAAFRLRWNKDYWDGGNVDVLNIYEKQYDVFTHAFDASNRDFSLLTRDNSTKEDFKAFIIKEIDAGRPVIALGIIGPPEAGIITGYDNNGDTVLGWNCFQENKEVASDVTFHDCGYYITSSWWDNPETAALVSIGEKKTENVTYKEILKNAIHILSTNQITVQDGSGKARDVFACGQAAYELWAASILDESQFSQNLIMPLKIEKLMCQGDAQAMVGEGRSYAACFLEWIGKNNTTVQKQCSDAASHFRKSAACAIKMYELRGGFQQSAEVLDNFMRRDVREKTAEMIMEAKDNEKKALEIIKEIATFL